MFGTARATRDPDAGSPLSRHASFLQDRQLAPSPTASRSRSGSNASSAPPSRRPSFVGATGGGGSRRPSASNLEDIVCGIVDEPEQLDSARVRMPEAVDPAPAPVASSLSPQQRLINACLDKDVDAVQAALADGADVNAPAVVAGFAKPWYPLHAAAHAGSHSVSVLLLAAGADASLRDGDKCTPLHMAASSGLHVLCQRLVEVHDADVNAHNARGATPLQWAADAQQGRTCEYLITMGAIVGSSSASSAK